MSKSGKKDLKEWRKIGEGGRRFVEEEPQWALHTDAAELGWGARVDRMRVLEQKECGNPLEFGRVRTGSRA